MLVAVMSLVGTLIAAVGFGALTGRLLGERGGWLVAWLVTMTALALALGALTVGHVSGFGEMTFRLYQLGASLLGPIWLAVGLVEVLAETVALRFATRLIGVSYSIVASVVVMADRLKRPGDFTTAAPLAAGQWDFLPATLIAVAHAGAVLTLVSCLIVAMVRNRQGDDYDYDNLQAGLVVMPLGMALVGVARVPVPGIVVAVVLSVAAAALWYVVARPLAPYDDEDEGEGAADWDVSRRRPSREADSTPAFGMRSIRPRYATPAEPPDEGNGHRAEETPVTPHRTVEELRRDGVDMPGRPSPLLYGVLTVYTLMEGTTEAFDRLAEDTVEAVRRAEPDILIFACHSVRTAPLQRIFYEVYRDEVAFAEHQMQSHAKRFRVEAQPYVLATNVIELQLNTAKVAPLPAAFGLV